VRRRSGLTCQRRARPGLALAVVATVSAVTCLGLSPSAATPSVATGPALPRLGQAVALGSMPSLAGPPQLQATPQTFSADGGASAGQLTQPTDLLRTQSFATLAGSAPSPYSYGDFEYRLGTAGAYKQVPAGDVTYQEGTAHPVWPVINRGGSYPAFTWSVSSTVARVGGADGELQVIACFYTSQSMADQACSATGARVFLNRHDFMASADTEALGPVQVSAGTGDARITATDVTVPSASGSLSIGRDITTLDPAGEYRNSLSAGVHDIETDLSSFSPQNVTQATATAPDVLGSASLRLAPDGAGTSTDSYTAVSGDLGGLRLGLIPGHDYTFTAKEYVPSSTGLAPGNASRGERPVAFTRVGSGPYVETDGSQPTAVNGWQLTSVTFSVPAGATEAFVRLYNGFSAVMTSDQNYYDDLTLMANSGFGPGWSLNAVGPNRGLAGDSLIDASTPASGGLVTLTGPDGAQEYYTTSGGSYPEAFSGIGDAAGDGSSLTKASSTTFSDTQEDGSTTTWTSPDSGATWLATAVSSAGASDGSTTTALSYDSGGRVVRVTGPAAAGINCGTAALTTPGCRSITILYATTTTATGTAAGSLGDYAGNIASVSFTAASPTSPTQMTTTGVAVYAYDDQGRLRSVQDPRLAHPLATGYSYDPGQHVSLVAPPGVNAWSLGYDTFGRLSGVSRADPAGGAADTSTVVYNVPLTGGSNGLPLPYGPASVATWGGQRPITATAFFPPTHPVAGTYDQNGAPSIAVADAPWAHVVYLDVAGRPVEDARYGVGAWQVATTDYDRYSRVVSRLQPQALDEINNGNSTMDPYARQLLQTAGYGPAYAAGALATQYRYEGSQLTEVDGPYHPQYATTGSHATYIDARQRTRYTYDEGSPGGATYNLLTSKVIDAVDSQSTSYDPQTVRLGYAPVVAGDVSGWVLRKPTTSTQLGATAATNIINTTRFNAQGQVLESRTPADTAGTHAGTFLSSYYTPTGTGACVNGAESGWLCQQAPAAQPSSGPQVRTVTIRYDMYKFPLSTTEIAGSTTRTTTVGYDGLDRPVSQAIAVAPVADGGTAVPAKSFGYDDATGLATTTSSTGGATLTSGYDSDGRVISYRDGANASTVTTYDAAGRVTTRTDGTVATSFVFDTSSEHRDLITTKNSYATAYVATYDGNARLVTQNETGAGITSNWTYDDAGEKTGLAYATQATNGGPLPNLMATFDDHGRVFTTSSPASNDTFAYDTIGRVTQASSRDTTVSPSTTAKRTYGYDLDSNRVAGCPVACSTSPTTTSSYDEADRDSGAGYTYDNLGRTLTVPSADLTSDPFLVSSSGPVTLDYYSNDRLRSERRPGNASNVIYNNLDSSDRVDSTYFGYSGYTVRNVYDDPTDTPAWTSEDYADGTPSSTEIFSTDIEGTLTARSYVGSGTSFLIGNLHGDIVGTLSNGSVSYAGYNEFGLNQRADTNYPRPYGWLGGKQRDSDGLGGLVQIGARVYNPTTGRFLQVDPVPGGSLNDYDYNRQDPVNNGDLSGDFSYPGCDLSPNSFGPLHLAQARCYNGAYDAWVYEQTYSTHPDCADDDICVLAIEADPRIVYGWGVDDYVDEHGNYGPHSHAVVDFYPGNTGDGSCSGLCANLVCAGSLVLVLFPATGVIKAVRAGELVASAGAGDLLSVNAAAKIVGC